MDTLLRTTEEISKFDPDQLIRKGKEINFEDIAPILRELTGVFKELNKTNEFWSVLPHERIEGVKRMLEELQKVFIEIKEFIPTAEGVNPIERRDGLSSSLRSVYQRLYNEVLRDFKLYILERKLSESNLSELTQVAEATVDEIETHSKKASKLIKAQQGVTRDSGIQKFQNIFGSQSMKHLWAAGFFGLASIAAILVIGWYGMNVFESFISEIGKDELSTEAYVQLFLTKFLFISFFSYVGYQLVKNYNANMHLYTINKHRENCLKVFNAFVESATNEETRNAVLLQATKAIFETGATGFVSAKDSNDPNIALTANRIVSEQLKTN